MPKLAVAVKRILVGRPQRSDRLAHSLLPKRIALPVFASDAMSSVAYAPEEIFLTLSVAGVASYALSPWIGLAVVSCCSRWSPATGRTCTPTRRAAATTRWRRSTSAATPA